MGFKPHRDRNGEKPSPSLRVETLTLTIGFSFRPSKEIRGKETENLILVEWHQHKMKLIMGRLLILKLTPI